MGETATATKRTETTTHMDLRMIKIAPGSVRVEPELPFLEPGGVVSIHLTSPYDNKSYLLFPSYFLNLFRTERLRSRTDRSCRGLSPIDGRNHLIFRGISDTSKAFDFVRCKVSAHSAALVLFRAGWLHW